MLQANMGKRKDQMQALSWLFYSKSNNKPFDGFIRNRYLKQLLETVIRNGYQEVLKL